MIRALLINLCLVICSAPSIIVAEQRVYPITVVGREDTLVTTATVTLGDIATVSSARVTDDEAVIGLKKIPLENAPAPGKSITVSASQILERMRDAGVDLTRVGYTFPRVCKIARASRRVNPQEILAVVKSLLAQDGGDVAVKDLVFKDIPQIAPGDTSFKVMGMQRKAPGVMKFALQAETLDKGASLGSTRFEVDALIDEWKEVPVTRRSLQKGDVVQQLDLTRARLNIASLPRDVVMTTDEAVGQEVTRSIASGELLRRDTLNIPAAVEKGKPVKMIIRGGAFEVTAQGTALERGIIGAEIRVRNESSGKIILGSVIADGLVEVSF